MERMNPNTSEQINRLTDTTFRNIEDLTVELRELAQAGKAYHRAMQAVAEASETFYGIMGSIAAKAIHLPGAVNQLGKCMEEMSTGYRRISQQYHNVFLSLNTDFIVPLEAKLSSDTKTASNMHKAYKTDQAKRKAQVDKTEKKLHSYQKKRHPTATELEKEEQLQQVLMDCVEELNQIRTEGLRRALIEERKLYCFIVNHYCSVAHNEIAYNAMAHQVLSTKVTDWTSVCSSPTDLPPESAVLLVDPMSPRAFSPGRFSYSAQEDDSPYLHGDHDVLSHSQRLPATNTSVHWATGDATSGSSVHGSGSSGTGEVSHKPTRRKSSVKALYTHHASSSGQLEFSKGDLLDAFDNTQKDGWQFGENPRTGMSGWFPTQFVDPEMCQPPGMIATPASPGTGQRQAPNAPPPIPERDYQSPTHRPSSAGTR